MNWTKKEKLNTNSHSRKLFVQNNVLQGIQLKQDLYFKDNKSKCTSVKNHINLFLWELCFPENIAIQCKKKLHIYETWINVSFSRVFENCLRLNGTQ